MIRIIILITTILLFQNYSFAQIRINEVCSSNKGNFYDEKFDTPDWIELYNYSDEPVNLINWKISDQSEFDSAWQLPDTIIQPGGFFVLCASGDANISNNIRIVTNSVGNTLNQFEDELSWAYIKLEGINKLTVDYNSFMANYIPEKNISYAGLILKEKNTSTSRMFAVLNSSDEGRQLFIQSRNYENEYRSVYQLKDRIKIDENRQELEIRNDSIYFRILDNKDYVIKELGYYFPLSSDYYLGFTILTHDRNVFDSLNINSVELNNDKLDVNDFKLKSFHNTNIKMSEMSISHSDFKLNSEGDSLYLFKNDIIYENLEIPELIENVSYSYILRKPNYYSEPTPGYKNSDYFDSISNTIDLSVDQIFYKEIDEFTFLDSSYFYTTDYSEPSLNSKYLNNFENKSSELITVKRIEEEKIHSATMRIPRLNKESILNDELHFHIYTDSLNLFNEHSGIITNTFSYSKVDAYLAVTKEFNSIFEAGIDLRKHGYFSNINRKQSSLRIIFNKNNYNNAIASEFFPIKRQGYGKAVILRNGGQDIKTMLRNRISMESAKNLNLIWNEHNNAVVYLNNEFWGIYNLRERIDDDYLAEFYNVDKSDINSFENEFNLKHGTPREMMELNKYLITSINDNSYQIIDSLIDIENFIDYIFLNTFNINHDWPHNNVVAYTIGEKWRFLLTDLDYSYKFKDAGASINYLSEIFNSNENIVTRLLNELLKYDKFNIQFSNRVCDILNTNFNRDSLVNRFMLLKSKFSKLVDLQNQRWPETLNDWETETNIIERFLSRRSRYYYLHLQDYYKKSPARLNLSSFPYEAGLFKVNSLTIDTSSWSGNYLQEVPVTITAVAKHGYRFKEWNIDSLGTEATITTTLSDEMNIEAIYEKADPSLEDKYIVINEIMYNADKDKDTKDWVELHNAGKEAVNLNGWSLIDEDETHTPFDINEDYLIQPDEYLILTRSRADFESIIDIDNKIFGDFDFGFGGNDILVLKDSDGSTHDSVNYDNDLPWPEGADGSGFTIELINPKLDNNKPDNWEISKFDLGSSGEQNSTFFDTVSNIDQSLYKNNFSVDYSNNILTINCKNKFNTILITDMMGHVINIDYNNRYTSVKADLSKLSNGFYICKVTDLNGNTQTFKLIR